MKRLQKFKDLITLKKLIRQKRTGTPDELAKRLSVSRATVYNIIDDLNSHGAEIRYCRTRCSFYCNNDMILDIPFGIEGLTGIDNPEELRKISGGCKLFSFRLKF